MKMNAEIRRMYKAWQEETGKYQEIDIDAVEFERLKLSTLHDANKVSTVKTVSSETFIEISDIDKVTKQYDLKGKMKSNLPKKSKQAEKGTILVSRVRPLLGGYTIIESNDDTFSSGDLNPITFPHWIYPQFLFFSILSPLFRNFLLNNQDTNGQKPTITKRLYNYKVIAPKTGQTQVTLKIQQSIVEFIEHHQTKVNAYLDCAKNTLSTIERMEKLLFVKIFSAEKDDEIVRIFNRWAGNKGYDIDLGVIEFNLVQPFQAKSLELIGSKKIGNHEHLEQVKDVDGLPVYDASHNILTYIDESKHPDKVFVGGGNNPPISFASEGNSSAGTNFFLHLENKFFSNNHRTVINFKTNEFYSQYLMLRLRNMKQEFGFKRGNTPSQNKLKEINLFLPLPTGFESFTIQKMIVEFIEDFTSWRKSIEKKVGQLEGIAKQYEDLLLAKAFEGEEG